MLITLFIERCLPMHVLLVDDHSLIRSGIKDSLSKHYGGVRVSEADCSKAALSLLHENQFDLALIDLFIPGEKLFGLVRECCGNNPDLPVIVLSSSENSGHIRRCIDLGAVGYVSKSSPQAKLFDAIDVVMAGGTYLPSLSTEAGSPMAAKVAAVDPLALDYSEVKGLLTNRQMDILALIAKGESNKQIARELGLSGNTVKIHVSAVFKALGLHNRSQAAVLGEKLGLSLPGQGTGELHRD